MTPGVQSGARKLAVEFNYARYVPLDKAFLYITSFGALFKSFRKFYLAGTDRHLLVPILKLSVPLML